MTQPIGSYNPNRYSTYEADEPVASEALTFCKRADTVLAGYLCDENTVTSNACRDPHADPVTAYVCDDRNLAAAQNTILSSMKEAIKLAFTALVGRSK